MFKRFHWILKSPKGPKKIPVRRYLTLEVYSALIEYENGKVKPAHYLAQIVDYDDPNDLWQNWIHGHSVHIVTDPALARAIGFFNIYHQYWALIEKGKTLMHCRNTTFAYSNEFNDYMKVTVQNQKIFLIISLILELENFYQKKERMISLSCLKNMIQSILTRLMKILITIQIMMVWKI